MSNHIVPPLVEVNPLPPIETARLFRPARETLSPIDKFIINTNAINRILANAAPGGDPSPELCSVVLLGYLSAVETFFRTLLSRLAHTDEITMRALGQKLLLFSVAMTGHRDTLAEALYEDSFASVKELKARLSEIGMRQLPAEIETAMVTYDRICHLRHCCVHRFGYLGHKNAYDLGLPLHGHLVGAIFSASADDLAAIADALQQFVKACNNHIFRFVIDRTVMDQNNRQPELNWTWRWTWKFRSDARRFRPYYDLFALVRGTPASASLKEAYGHFRVSNKSKVAAMTERRRSAST